MTVASSTAAFVATALPPLLLTWRCRSCRRIILELEWEGRLFHRHKCKCNTWNVLPEDAEYLRDERCR